MLGALLFVVVVASELGGTGNVQKLLSQCSDSELKSCEKLARVVQKLSDQTLLGEIAGEARIAYFDGAAINIAAIERITNQSVLQGLLANSPDSRHCTYVCTLVEEAIFKKLTDQSLLEKTALDWKLPPEVRKLAIQKLQNQQILTKIATSEEGKDFSQDKDFFVRDAAVSMLSDEALLEQIATHDGNLFVRRAAAMKLTNQAVLEQIAAGDVDSHVREEAVRKVTSQIILEKIARADKDVKVRQTATGMLTNQSLLNELAHNRGDTCVQLAAVAHLTDGVELEKIAQLTNSSDLLAPEVAVARLRVVLQNPIIANRLPEAQLQTECRDERKDYQVYEIHSDEMKFAVGPTVAGKGNTIRLRIVNGPKSLADGSWTTAFPTEIPNVSEWQLKSPVTGCLSISLANVIHDLLSGGEFLRRDFVELSRSNVPEVRKAALAKL